MRGLIQHVERCHRAASLREALRPGATTAARAAGGIFTGPMATPPARLNLLLLAIGATRMIEWRLR